MKESIIQKALTLAKQKKKITPLDEEFQKEGIYNYLLHDIELIKEVFLTKHKIYIAPPHPYRDTKNILGALGFKTLKMPGSPLKGDNLDRSYEQSFEKLAIKISSFLNKTYKANIANEINLTDLISHLVLEVMILNLFDFEQDNIGKDFYISTMKLENFIKTSRETKYSLRSPKEFEKELKEIASEQDKLLLKIIDAKEETRTLPKEEKKKLSRAMTRSLLNAFGGTSTTIVWLLHLLSENENELANARKEIDEVLLNQTPKFKDLEKLTYLEAILKETMRLYPAGWMISRTSIESDNLDNISIPKGSTLYACIYSIHRDTKYWEHPDRFMPQRFLNSKKHEAFIPFGIGPRKCVGANFAFTSMQFIASIILSKYEITFQKKSFTPVPRVALRPSPEAMVQIEKIK